MNSIEAIQFKPDHFDLLHVREHERETVDLEQLKALASNASAWTFVADGRIIFVGGYVELWKGVAEVFVLPSVYISDDALGFQRAVKRTLEQWAAENGWHRMQSSSLADDKTDRWMKSLGFTCEGTLLKYTANQLNYRQWARLI